MQNAVLAPPCVECHGKGPAQRFILSERGGIVPLPFIPCSGCGLEYPSSSSLSSEAAYWSTVIACAPMGTEAYAAASYECAPEAAC